MNSTRFLSIVIALLVCSILSAQTDSLVLRPDGTAGKDALVFSYYPSNNFGGSDEAILAAWTNGGTNVYKRFYIQFDLSSIPAGTAVDSAYLYLYYNLTASNNGSKHSGSNSFYIRRVTSSWSESTISYNNVPGSTTIGQIVVPSTTNDYQDFKINVKNMVQTMVDSTNYGFFMRLVNETYYTAINCATSDHSIPGIRPMIKVFFNSCQDPKAGFDYAINGNSVSFQDTSNVGGGATYFWDFGDGNFSILKNPTNVYLNAGVYNVCSIVTDSCGSDTTCQIVKVCVPNTAGFNYIQTNPLVVAFQGNPPGMNSYWWDFGDSSFSIIRNPVHTYSKPGNYNVCLTITDSCDADTSCNAVPVTGLGASEFEFSAFSVYPNPTNGILHIDVDGNQEAILNLYDLTGKLVWTGMNHKEIDLSNLEQGVYFLQLNIDGKAFQKKIMKL